MAADPGPTMRDFTSYPSQAYDYIHTNFGLTGLIIAGVGMVVAVVALLTWADRRK